MTQPKDAQPSPELIERTLTSLRVAHEDLTELIAHHNGIAALVQTARGTALLHDLRLDINQLNKLLPFKG